MACKYWFPTLIIHVFDSASPIHYIVKIPLRQDFSMVDMDKIVSLCKRRGFIFQSSEIYGGTGSCWDYGPLGVELKNNVKRVGWRDNVQKRADMVRPIYARRRRREFSSTSTTSFSPCA